MINKIKDTSKKYASIAIIILIHRILINLEVPVEFAGLASVVLTIFVCFTIYILTGVDTIGITRVKKYRE
jgi:hypothetical protein